LKEFQLVSQLPILTDDDAGADHVGMAVEILRRRMDDQVDAELQRPLKIRAAERVVDNGGKVPAFGKRGDPFEVDDTQERIGRRLYPKHSCFRADRSFDGFEVSEVGEGDRKAGRTLADAFEQPERAAIDIVGGDDMGAYIEQLEDGGDPGKALSRSATARSNAMRVGFWLRAYS
jgi:hypothetical protein